MTDLQAPLRENVKLLGQLLGNTIRQDLGDAFVEEVEQIRGLAKSARSGEGSVADLIEALRGLEDSDLVPIARAFSQFLNLANLAEEYHRVRRRRSLVVTKPDPHALDRVLERLLQEGVPDHELVDKAKALNIVAPNYLLSFARATVTDLVTRGGFPPFLLPLVTFEGLHARAAQQQQGATPSVN